MLSKKQHKETEMEADNFPIEASNNLHVRFGNSILVQFVQSHSGADIIRELVQNEYDAHGAEMRVEFQANRLVVTGTGKAIDRDGWRRLSVVMGTGSVGDSGEEIPAYSLSQKS